MRDFLRTGTFATVPISETRPAGTRLVKLVADSGRHVPMYRRLWEQSGINVDALSADEDFERLPRLDKSTLREARPEDRIHDGRRGARFAEERSSGSSGEPLTVFKDRSAQLTRRWAFLRALLVCGYRPGLRCMLLTSRRSVRWPTFAMWSYASIAEETETLVARVESLRPEVLYGPLSTLELMAAHRLERGGHWAPRMVVSTAEQLTGQRRELIERGFGVPVSDFYGMTEFGLIAYRPADSAHYSLARSTLLLEYLPVANEPGLERLIVTDVAERTSPLIRYDTGDLVRRDMASPERPIVEFAGRSMDCIVRPDGGRVSPYRLDVFLEHVEALSGFEVVQQRDLSIDVMLEVSAEDAAAVCAEVRRGLEAVLGTAVRLRIGTGAIHRERSAKFRPIRSLAGCCT